MRSLNLLKLLGLLSDPGPFAVLQAQPATLHLVAQNCVPILKLMLHGCSFA